MLDSQLIYRGLEVSIFSLSVRKLDRIAFVKVSQNRLRSW